MNNGENEVVSKLGGILYLRYSCRSSERPSPQIKVEWSDSEATPPIPYFQEGKTTDAQWKKMLEVTDIPFAELSGKRVIVTGLAAHAKIQADRGQSRQELLDTYAEMLDVQDAFSTLSHNAPDPRDRPSPLRLLVVETVRGDNPTSSTTASPSLSIAGDTCGGRPPCAPPG
ncbi:peptidase M60-like family-domain-containing protein [Aspergillus multicolor]|uniref:peptidase M60-like family-domain-containing protein n=1 Tax=Aspergillus multicolor TaxID=41759 RepID=UPI003CCD0BAB